MVIVDNSILSFAFDLPNGVPINSFMGDEQEDKDLLYLISFLEEAFYQKDIRTACEESFKLQYLLSTITNKWNPQLQSSTSLRKCSYISKIDEKIFKDTLIITEFMFL